MADKKSNRKVEGKGKGKGKGKAKAQPQAQAQAQAQDKEVKRKSPSRSGVPPTPRKPRGKRTKAAEAADGNAWNPEEQMKKLCKMEEKAKSVAMDVQQQGVNIRELDRKMEELEKRMREDIRRQQEREGEGEGQSERECCSICLRTFNDISPATHLLSCPHLFHFPCISRWMLNNRTCPLCRRPLEIQFRFATAKNRQQKST